MRARTDIAAVAVVAAAVVAAPVAARANPVDTQGFGGRGPAMGGAQTAASDDTGANYYNPAITASFDAVRIDVGYQHARHSLAVNGLDVEVNNSRGIIMGLVAPGKIGSAKIALSGAVFLPDERVSRTRTLPSHRPRWSLYDNRPQRLFLAANLAAQITPWLYFGGGIAYMSASVGTVGLTGRIGYPDPLDSELLLEMDVDVKTVRYGQAGVLIKARPWLDIGVTYRGQFVLDIDLGFRLAGDVGQPGGMPVVDDGSFDLTTLAQDLFQPMQLAAGFDARLTRDLRLAFDVVYQRWSTMDNPAAKIVIETELGDLQELVDLPEAPPLPEAGFHDILVPHVGLEYTATRAEHVDWQLRGGYSFEPSPAPVQWGETNFIDNDKHTFCFGTGLELRNWTEVLPRPLSLDAFVTFTSLTEREHRKISAVDPIGDYRSDGWVVHFGFVTRWRF